MESLNLNIDNYSMSDLQQLFKIDIMNMNENESIEESNYVNMILNKKEKIANQLTNNSDISQDKKMEIFLFLDTACNKLVDYMSSNSGLYSNNFNGTWGGEVGGELKNVMNQVNNHMVITNHNEIEGKHAKIAEGRNADSDDYPAGWLNPINVRTINTGINIDSRFRDNYYNTNASDFVVNLPDVQKRVVKMRIASIDIPTTFYAISRKRGNATCLIVQDISSSITPPGSGGWISLKNLSNPSVITNFTPEKLAWLLVLPDGNYELWQDESKASNLISAMNNAIALAIPGAIDANDQFAAFGTPNTTDYLNPANDIAFSVHQHDGRSVFAIPSTTGDDGRFENSSFLINFSVDYAGNSDVNTNIQLCLGWQLGFRIGVYRSKIRGSILSEGICMPSGPRYAFISIDDGKQNSEGAFLSAFSESFMDKNIISKIYISNIMDDTSVYKPVGIQGLSTQLNRTREYFGPVDIQRLHIRILDEYGQLLDLNHMDWSMTLVFEKLYS